MRKVFCIHVFSRFVSQKFTISEIFLRVAGEMMKDIHVFRWFACEKEYRIHMMGRRAGHYVTLLHVSPRIAMWRLISDDVFPQRRDDDELMPRLLWQAVADRKTTIRKPVASATINGIINPLSFYAYGKKSKS